MCLWGSWRDAQLVSASCKCEGVALRQARVGKLVAAVWAPRGWLASLGQLDNSRFRRDLTLKMGWKEIEENTSINLWPPHTMESSSHMYMHWGGEVYCVYTLLRGAVDTKHYAVISRSVSCSSY